MKVEGQFIPRHREKALAAEAICRSELKIIAGTLFIFFVHFLYSPFLLFFIGIRESPSSICLAHPSTALRASENGTKRMLYF